MKDTIDMTQQRRGLRVLKTLKKCTVAWIASSLLFFHMPTLSAEGCCPFPVPCEEVYSTDVGGCGYQTCRRCPVLAPAVALAVVALTGIIAVALQTDHGHLHAHHGHHHHRKHHHHKRCCN